MTEKKWVIPEGDGVYQVRTCAWSPPGDHPVGCGLIVTVKDGKITMMMIDDEQTDSLIAMLTDSSILP